MKRASPLIAPAAPEVPLFILLVDFKDSAQRESFKFEINLIN
jgi:hypothetical protein